MANNTPDASEMATTASWSACDPSDALRFLAAESLPHLPAHVPQREPERLGGRLDVDPQLPRSALERVGDVVHAGEAAQAVLLHTLDGRLQLHGVLGTHPPGRSIDDRRTARATSSKVKP